MTEDPARHDFRFSVRTRHPRRKGLTLAQRAGRAAGTWEMIGDVLPGDDLKVAQEIQRLDFEANQLKRKIAKNKQDAIDFTTDSIDAIPDPSGFAPSDVFGAGQTAEDTWAASASEHTIAHIANVTTEFVADGIAAGYKLQARLVAKWFRVQTIRMHRVSDSALVASWTLDWANNVYTQSVFTAWVDIGETADGSYYFTGEGNHVGDNFVKELVVDIRWVPTGYPVVDNNATAASAVTNTPAGNIASTDVQAALNELDTEKANLASPALTGNPTAPTQTAGNNSTRVATTAFVTAAVAGGSLAASAITFSPTGGVASTDVQAAIAEVDSEKANIASPTLTGTPAGPTAAVDTNTTQLATTAFVVAQAGASSPIVDGSATVGTSKRYSREDHIHPTDTTLAPKASPTLTGTPAAPTAAVDTNTTQIATTAYVIAQASASGDGTPANNGTAARGTSTHYARADHVHATDTTLAPKASPTLTGTPAAPTAAVDTNTTQIATTAFVIAQAASATPIIDGVAAVGTSTRFARGDHVHPTDTTRAALASPTLTGTPAAPTAAVDTNTTQLATTAFVIAQAASATPIIDGTGAVGTSTRFARGDHVHPTDTTRAALASPTFTGTPAAPTAAVDTNTTQVATTAFVLAQAASASPVMNGVAAVGTSTRYARADHVHATDTSLAPLASPTLTGTPAAPTAAVDTNTTQVATTAFVIGQGYAKLAGPTFTGTVSAPTPSAADSSTKVATTAYVQGELGNYTTTTSLTTLLAAKAPLASPTFTGTPASTTAAVDTNTTQIATTAFVIGQAYAKLASPALTGNPTGPTPAAGDNDTSLATTAFVQAALAASLPMFLVAR